MEGIRMRNLIKKLPEANRPTFMERMSMRHAGEPRRPMMPGTPAYKKGGATKKMAEGGKASARADGCASKGKTKGRFV